MNKEDFNVTFIFPPQWTPQNPHYAMTSIAGHLRHHGYNVKLMDLNVEFYDKILTPRYIQYSREKTLLEYDYLKLKVLMKCLTEEEDENLDIESAKLLHIEKYLKEEQEAWNNTHKLIDEAVSVTRDRERFYEANVLVDALIIIDDALKIISLPYYPERLCFNDFRHTKIAFNMKDILSYCTDKKRNMFYDFYEEVMPAILENKPDLIAISINSFSQVLPGLTLAKMVKEKNGNFHINIGGNFFGRVKDNLLGLPGFFEHFCHTLVMGEGEKFMLELCDTVRLKEDLHKVPSTLYLKDGRVIYTYKGQPEKMNNLGIQDLAGLKLYKYFTSHIVLCIQSSKGCYWGKCSFCDSDFGVEHDGKSLDRLVQEIKYLRDKYNIRHYEFMDESINPAYMKSMAERFIEEKLDIKWFSNGRLEEEFTPELLCLLQRSGLTMVLWGFESGNERIMDLINKGINVEKRYDILKASSDCGIWNFAYIFFGFPTETEKEATETINAMCAHKDIIHSYGRSVFTLGKHSKLRDDAKKFGIVDIIEDNQELSTNLYYKSTSGMTDKEVDAMIDLCIEKCKDAYGMPLWMYLKYRENLHLYIAKYGADYVKNYPTKKWYMQDLVVW